MRDVAFPFVARQWDNDREVISWCCENTTLGGTRPSWFIIYPEGTALYSKSLARSQKYMKEQNKTPCVLGWGR